MPAPAVRDGDGPPMGPGGPRGRRAAPGGGPGIGGPGDGRPRWTGRPGRPRRPAGMGGPGSHEGGRDRGGWQGRPNAMAFGNNRRDPRGSYNGNASSSASTTPSGMRERTPSPAPNVDKPSYSDVRGGIMFGGPLQIPKLVSAEKRIFFIVQLPVRAQPHRHHLAAGQHADRPRAQRRLLADHRPGWPAVIYDPRTGLPFPGNTDPDEPHQQRLHRVAPVLPAAQPGLCRRSNYQTAWTGSSNSDNLNARLSNIRLGSKDRIEGGIGYQGRNSTTPNLFQFVDTRLRPRHQRQRRLVPQPQRQADQQPALHLQPQPRRVISRTSRTVTNVAADLGIAGTSQNPMNWGPPNLGFTNYAGLVRRQCVPEPQPDRRRQREPPMDSRHPQPHLRRRLPAPAVQSVVRPERARRLFVQRRSPPALSSTASPRAAPATTWPTFSSASRHGVHPLRQPGQVFPRLRLSTCYVNDDWRISTKFTHRRRVSAGTTPRR